MEPQYHEMLARLQEALQNTKKKFNEHDIDGIALLMLKPEQLGSPSAKDANKTDYLEIEPLGARQRLWFFIARVCHHETQNPNCNVLGCTQCSTLIWGQMPFTAERKGRAFRSFRCARYLRENVLRFVGVKERV